MEIISPENSFLDFNYFEDTTCLNEDIIPLPKCDNLAIKAQIEIDSDEDITIDTPLYIAISDTTCNVILDEDIEITPICSKYKFVTTIEDVVIDETSPYNLCNEDVLEPTETIEFLTNPFDEITSTDLEFDLELSPIGNQLQLYINNNVYILGWNSSPLMPEMVVSQQDNVYFVLLSTFTPSGDAGKINQLKVFLQDVLDVNEGTTTTVSSNTFTIEDVPSGSYLNNWLFIENISSVTASTNIGELTYWNNNKINYYQSSESTNDVLYKFEQALSASTLLNLKIGYFSNSTTYDVTITISDGVDTQTFTPTLNLGTGEIEISFYPANTATYDITIEIDDVETIGSGLSFNSITLDEVIGLEGVSVEDCDGNIDIAPTLEIDYIGNVAIIEFTDTYPSVFRFIFEDTEENTLTSRWYKLADKDDCTYGKLYQIKWSNDCNLGEINYVDSSQVNELLLSGVLIKGNSEVIDSVDNVTASGKKISVYKNIQSVYELRLHPYLSETFENILEGIFEHSDVTINGVSFNTVDTMQTSEIDLGIYTSRIDLYKSGTELITKVCC